MSTATTTTAELTTSFTTAELEAVRNILQNETAWDRDADTGGFNAYHSADNHTRPGSGVLTPVHEEAEWKVLNSALLRIDIELERRKQRQEKFDRLFPELPASPTSQTGQVEAKQVSLEPQPQPDTDAQLQGHMFGDTRPQRSEVDHQVDFRYHRIGRD